MIVSRAEIGLPPSPAGRIPLPSRRLWLHHSAGGSRGAASVRAIHRDHTRRRGMIDIAYSFLVDDTGTIYEGRGAGRAGGHTRGDNSGSHAVCAIGNYETDIPPPRLIDGIVQIIRHGRAQGWWGDLTGGHQDAPGAATACPGRHLQALIPDIRTRSRPRPAAPQTTDNTDDPEDDDMGELWREEGTPTVWVVTPAGAPVWRRPVGNQTELQLLQWSLAARGHPHQVRVVPGYLLRHVRRADRV